MRVLGQSFGLELFRVLKVSILIGFLAFFSNQTSFGMPGKKGDWKPPENEWVGYLVVKKGKMKPIELPLELHPDKDWILARYTDYQGPKPQMAVLSIVNKARTGTSKKAPVAAIEEILAASLIASNRFKLIERNNIDAILKERELSRGEEFSNESASQIGQLLNVRYIILGVINEWASDKGNASAFGIKAKSIAEVAMTIKVLDVETGEVLQAMTERAKAGSWGLGIRGLGQGDALGGPNSPINYAVAACINKVTHRLCLLIKDRPWKGKVLRVSEDSIYLKGGDGDGLKVGDRLIASSKGEDLIDPDTGLVLDSESNVIGTLVITKVKEKVSIAQVENGCRGLKRGDSVEIIVADGD